MRLNDQLGDRHSDSRLQDGLVASFSPDGGYTLRERITDESLAPHDIPITAQGRAQLSVDQLAEIHRLLTARASCYATADREGRDRIVALTRFDIDCAISREDEEELLLRRYIETGDFESE